jgi:hypothetical protein
VVPSDQGSACFYSLPGQWLRLKSEALCDKGTKILSDYERRSTRNMGGSGNERDERDEIRGNPPDRLVLMN